MAYELSKKIVIDTEEFNNFAVGITLPIQKGETGYFRQSFQTFDQIKFEEDVENTINDALEKWLPYVIVDDIDVDVSKDYTDNNQAKVSIKFKQQGQQQLGTVTFLVEE